MIKGNKSITEMQFKWVYESLGWFPASILYGKDIHTNETYDKSGSPIKVYDKNKRQYNKLIEPISRQRAEVIYKDILKKLGRGVDKL